MFGGREHNILMYTFAHLLKELRATPESGSVQRLVGSRAAKNVPATKDTEGN